MIDTIQKCINVCLDQDLITQTEYTELTDRLYVYIQAYLSLNAIIDIIKENKEVCE